MTSTKRIRQKQSSDCGVACLAMLLELPYKTVKEAAYALKRKQGYSGRSFPGLSYNDDKELTAMFGECMKIWWVGKKSRKAVIKRLQGRKAILCVPGMNQRKPEELHAVYWDGDHLYDPTPGRGYIKDGAHAFSVMFYAAVLADECNESIQVVNG